MDQEKKIENISLDELNKLLQQNKPLFLQKANLLKKAKRCDLVLKKMVISRKLIEKWKGKGLSLISKLQTCLGDNQTGAQVIEAISFYADRELERQNSDRKGWVWSLRQLVKEESKKEKDLFEIFESQNPKSKNKKNTPSKKQKSLSRDKKKSAGRGSETSPSSKKKKEIPKKSFNRMRSLSNKRPQRPPILGKKSKQISDSKKKKKYTVSMNNIDESNKPKKRKKETVNFNILSDEEEIDSFDPKSLKPPTDWPTNNQNPESLKLEKILNNYEPSPRSGNGANNRITFGTRINRMIKGPTNHPKSMSEIDSIFSFKNVSIFSRGDSSMGAAREGKSSFGKFKDREETDFNLQISTSSFKTNSTHKKFEISMEDNNDKRNRANTEGKNSSIEKYSAYQELKKLKMNGGGVKRASTSITKEKKEMDSLRESRDTIKNSGERAYEKGKGWS